MRAIAPAEYVGKRFGRWTALAHFADSITGQTIVTCKCDCGKGGYVLLSNLRSGKSGGCRKCSGLAGNKNPSWRGYKDITGQMWGVLRKSAAARGIAVEIAIEDLQDLWERQGGKCALSGIPLAIAAKGRGLTASVDRIDSSKGYTKGNLQFVHKDINLMKNGLDQAYFIEMCRRVTSHA